MPTAISWKHAIAAAAVFLALTCPVRGEEDEAAAVAAAIDRALQFWQVPGVAVAVVRNDEVVYLKGHGLKDLSTRQPVTPDTVFPLASCSKAFTTTALAMLASDGAIDWDDRVRKHVPFFHLSDPSADALVTLRDLVTHRTGVRGHELLWYRSPWSQVEIIRRIGHVPVELPFRSSFQYQTTMFQTAGYAVGTASKSNWADFVRARLLDPLGMDHTRLTTAEALKLDDHASPHRLDTEGKLAVIPWYDMQEPDPAGSVHSTASDLTHWMRFQLGDGAFEEKRLLSPAALRETHTPQVALRLEGLAREENPDTLQMSYGLGWVIHDYRGKLVIAHAGAIDGFRAQITLVPSARLGIALLANRHQTRMNLALSNTLLDLLLGLPRKDWNRYLGRVVEASEQEAAEKFRRFLSGRVPDTRPSREWKAYAGEYRHAAYGSARVEAVEDGLVWKWNQFEGRLRHFHFDTFLLEHPQLGTLRMVFTLDAAGTVAHLEVLDVMGVKFERVP